jgi:hypothetical protein
MQPNAFRKQCTSVVILFGTYSVFLNPFHLKNMKNPSKLPFSDMLVLLLHNGNLI